MAYTAATSVTLLAVLLSVPQLIGDFAAYQIGLFLIYGIVAQGIGFLWGKTGVLPLGQALFFGIAAYACAHILSMFESMILQVTLLVGVVACLAMCGFSLAFLVFKGRSDSGPYFSLITLALAMICEQVAGTATSLTGGFNGLSGYPIFANLDQFSGLYYVIAVAAVLSTLTLSMLNKLPAGLVARAVADNEKRLQLFGFPTHMIKGLAFGLSAAFAALAGILFANHQGIVTPTSSGFLLSANLVIWTAVGGRNHVYGPLIGAVAIGYLSSELRGSFIYWEMIVALVFIVVVLKAPGGIAEYIVDFFTRFRSGKLHTKTRQIKAPATTIDTQRDALVFSKTNVKMGTVSILNGVDLSLPKSGIVCVIGPNGAGKTSLLNVITGNLPVSEGNVSLGQNNFHNQPTHQAFTNGIARKLQVPSVFSSLSVSDNIALAMLAGRARFIDFFRPSTFLWRTTDLDNLLKTDAMSALTDMSKPVSTLAQGHRQFLEFAMTTAAQSKILLLDEPCAGLSTDETKLMTKLVKDFQDRNKGLIVLIEHDMSIVRALADRVVVLHQGVVLFEGSYDEVRANKDVREVYSGGNK